MMNAVTLVRGDELTSRRGFPPLSIQTRPPTKGDKMHTKEAEYEELRFTSSENCRWPIERLAETTRVGSLSA